jgi:hypothetical protein
VTGRPNVTGRTDGVGAFWWTIAEFCQQELLPYVFADVEDERNQYTMVVHQVATRLRTQGAPAGTDGAWTVDGTLLRPYDDLVDFVVAKVSDEDSRWEWAGPAVGTGTVNAFVRRLRSSLKAIRPLVRADLPRTGQHGVSTEGSRSRSSTCTRCPTAGSGSWSGSCCGRRPSARRRPARAGCCSR